MSNSRRVSYFYDIEVGNYHYGQGASPPAMMHVAIATKIWSTASRVPHES